MAIIKQVRAAGIEVCSEIEFGYRYKGDSKIIAITGSNGKSTTTKLTYEILKNAGYDAAMGGQYRIQLCQADSGAAMQMVCDGDQQLPA